MDSNSGTVKTARTHLGLPQREGPLVPQLRYYASSASRSLACLILRHDPVEWSECPSLTMCRRCHGSWLETRR